MNAATELTFLKDCVNKAMLFDETKPGKVAGHNSGAEVDVVVARHLGFGARNTAFNSCSHFVGGWHQRRG